MEFVYGYMWLYVIVCHNMYLPQISTAFKFLFFKNKKREQLSLSSLRLLIVY